MRRIVFGGLALAAIVPLLRPTAGHAAPPLSDDDAGRLRKIIRPLAGEDPFDTIPWETSLWDARVKAAAAGKPILLWEMDGHPLGCG
jgi:hypothetical protein